MLAIAARRTARRALLLALLSADPALAARPLSDVRLGLGADQARLVLETETPLEYRLFSLDKPARLVLDLPGVGADPALRGLADGIAADHPYLKAIRFGRPDDDVARVVLDLKSAVESRTFRLAPDGAYGHRLVLDVSSARAVAPGPPRRVGAARVEVGPESTRILLESERPLPHRLFPLDPSGRVVLDLHGVELNTVLTGISDEITGDHPYLKAIRVGQPKHGVTRLVVDLKAPVRPRIFAPASDAARAHQLVLALSPADGGTEAWQGPSRTAPGVAGSDGRRLVAARLGMTPERTRIAFESDSPIAYRLFSLDGPSRLVLDLEHVQLDGLLRGLTDDVGARHPYLRAIRVGRPYDGVARVVLDLKAGVEPRTFRLAPDGEHGHRLVLDVYPTSASASTSSGLQAPTPGIAPSAPLNRDTAAGAQPAAADRDALLLLEVRLDRTVLSKAIPAYERGDHTLLPLGELARLLSLAIHTQPERGIASGYILSEDRGFSLHLPRARVTLSGNTASFDPALAAAEPDDIYVASELLERWLPLKLDLNRSTLTLQVHTREQLPLQARLERERRGARAGRYDGDRDPGYPRHESPYRLLGMPFIDQTLGLELRKNEADAHTRTRYTGFMTADLLGMESSLFVGANSEHGDPKLRLALGRYDPDADLLGRLHARSWAIGSLSSPSVPHIARGRLGEGLVVSNRPLSQPTSFDRQTFEGDLPPGWDVELYRNGALLGFQIAGPDGRYRFEDLPLLYGRNDFRLVFHGPLGQVRVERHTFSLGQQMTRPGEFHYRLVEHRDEADRRRTVAQFDWGLARHLAVNGGFTALPLDDMEQRYANLGLRTFWRSLILSGDLIQAENGGSLSELGLKTGLGGMAIDLRHAQLNDFISDEYPASSDPIASRSQLRLFGTVPVGSRRALPLSVDFNRDLRQSGAEDLIAEGRLSAYVYRTALTQSLTWRSHRGVESLTGGLQLSRRVGDIGLSGDFGYRLSPEFEPSVFAVTAEKPLTEGYRLNLGLVHTFANPRTLHTMGLSKDLGRFGLGVSASYSSADELAVGAQIFIAAGREPRRPEWRTDALPMANTGAASVRVFLDDNGNGIQDPGEAPIPGVGFTVNGGPHPARADADGIAYLTQLPARQHVDVGLDTATLLDPQWLPVVPGMRLVPRPGHVAQLEFPVLLTGEIDGTVYLSDQGTERGVGDLRLELLDNRGTRVATATSAWDGFYIVEAVPPGSYRLRISPEQLERLKLTATEERKVIVPADGEFVSGIDFFVRPAR